MSIITFFQEEEQLIQLYLDKNAAVSEFTTLFNKGRQAKYPWQGGSTQMETEDDRVWQR